MKNIEIDHIDTPRSNDGRTRMRLTPRGRRAILTLLAVPAVAFGAFGVTQAATAEAGSEAADVVFETVTVQPGDTLWGIAQEIAPHDDPREVIIDIQDLNDVTGAVQAGATLSIPAQYSE